MKPTAALMSVEEFEAVMPFYVTRAGGVSKEIAFAHYVMGLPTPAIVEKIGTSKQNVVKTVARFAEAHYRAQQAERVMASAATASPKIAEILASFDKPPKPKQAAPAAKKAAAKKTALKVVAAKKPATKKTSK